MGAFLRETARGACAARGQYRPLGTAWNSLNRGSPTTAGARVLSLEYFFGGDADSRVQRLKLMSDRNCGFGQNHELERQQAWPKSANGPLYRVEPFEIELVWAGSHYG